MKNILFTIFITLASLTSCKSEKPILCNPEDTSVENVLLIYMGGDNNLSYETYEKINAIKKGWNRVHSNKILIYHDPFAKPPGLYELLCNHDGTTELTTIKTYNEENSASPGVLSRTISEVRALYPDASHRLLIFSHATGWLPQGTSGNPQVSPRNNASPTEASPQKTIIPDGDNQTEIINTNAAPQKTIIPDGDNQTEIINTNAAPQKTIIQDGANQIEIADLALAIPDNAFEFIVFETCHMAGIETFYELRNKAKYIMGSAAEIVSPGFTNNYLTDINLLFESTPVAFAQSVFNHVNSLSGWRRSATYSVIKTSELEPLANWIRNNCDFGIEPDINDIQHFDRYQQYRLFFDFEQYHALLLDTDNHRTQLKKLVQNCVIWESSTPEFLYDHSGFSISHHSGITTYIRQAEFPLTNTAYEKLQWSIKTRS